MQGVPLQTLGIKHHHAISIALKNFIDGPGKVLHIQIIVKAGIMVHRQDQRCTDGFALFRIVFGMNVQQSLTNEHVEAFRAPGICRPFYIDTG